MRAPDRLRGRPAALLLAAAAILGAGCLAAAAAAGQEAPRRASVEDMDMGLLQNRLLKIYVCEKEAALNAKALEKLRISLEAAGTGKVTLESRTKEQIEEDARREKDISHYLLFEKTNAIQMIQIVDRILGTEVHLAGEGRADRAILDRKVELIEIPRGPKGGTDIREAAKIISEVLGCPVRVEQPDTDIFRLWFTMGPTTGEAIIKQVASSQPFDWKIVDGTLVFRHRDLAEGASGEGPKEGEDRVFDEEDRRRENEEIMKKRAEEERKKAE